MNKYIFPIIKWKIKSWIKNWIYNQEKAPAPVYPLSEIIEGTSPLTLENSIRKKFNIFNVNGNTVQNGEPTPETPIPVENVSGEVEVKVENKNLNDGSIVKKGYYNANGTFASNNTFRANVMKVSPNTRYALSTTLSQGLYNAMVLLDKNRNLISTISYLNKNGAIVEEGYNNEYFKYAIFTTPANCYYVSAGLLASTDEAYNNQVMLEPVEASATTPTTYEPHEEQTATFPLAEGQVLHIGDTLEDDGIHQRRAIKIFDGTEDWKAHNTISSWFYVDNIMNFFTDNNKNDFALCTHFIQEKYSNVLNITNGKFSLGLSSDNINKRAVFKCDDFLTVEEWKAFLVQQYANGTPVKLELKLTNLTIIPYTAEQQTAYENLKNLYSYKGTTYISSTNEPSPVFEVQYYMEEGEV